MLRTPATLFRTLAIAEAASWTLLIAGLIIRATTGWAPAVTIGGGIHGFVFLSYGATVILVALNSRWPVIPLLGALASAVIPYATIPAEIMLQRNGYLAGEWKRHIATIADPRWYDRPMLWLLRHPWVLVVGIAAAIVVLYTVLLMVGPPGGKG